MEEVRQISKSNSDTALDKSTSLLKSRRFKVATIISILTILVVAVAVFFLANLPLVQISNATRTSVRFPIITPQKLPPNTRVSTQPSYDSEKRIVITRLQTSDGQSIVLSQQAKPENIDLKQVDTAETFLSTVGTVYLLKGEKGKLQAIIDTSDSWLMINADATIGQGAIKQLINHLG